jgi:hypothetical protein
MMGIDIFNARLVRTGDGRQLVFERPKESHNEVWDFLNTTGKRTNDFFRLRIDRPFRPRKTGPRSASNRVHGHCADLAEQLTDEARGVRYTAEQVKAAMKRMAVAEGWPTYLDLDGTEQPMSEADASVEQETVLNRVIQRFADQHGFWLTEYHEEEGKSPVPYKSIGGRTKAEMDLHWKRERDGGIF